MKLHDACLAGIVLLSACSSSAPEDPVLKLGATATVKNLTISCYESTKELDAAIQAISVKDEQGYREHTEGKAIFLQPGDHVLVIDQGGFMGAEDRRVRVTSGSNTDQACWLDFDDVRFFKDIKEQP